MASVAVDSILSPAQPLAALPPSINTVQVGIDRQAEEDALIKITKLVGTGWTRVEGNSIFTDDLIITFKQASQWGEGVGILTTLGVKYPKRQKELYLAGPAPEGFPWSDIQCACRLAEIDVLRDDLHYDRLQAAASHQPIGFWTAAHIKTVISRDILEVPHLDPGSRLTALDYAALLENIKQGLKVSCDGVRSMTEVYQHKFALMFMKDVVELNEQNGNATVMSEVACDYDAAADGFIENELVIEEGGTVQVRTVRAKAKEYCAEQHYDHPATFYTIVEEKLIAKGLTKGRGRYGIEWKGLTLLDEPEPTLDDDCIDAAALFLMKRLTIKPGEMTDVSVMTRECHKWAMTYFPEHPSRVYLRVKAMLHEKGLSESSNGSIWEGVMLHDENDIRDEGKPSHS